MLGETPGRDPDFRRPRRINNLGQRIISALLLGSIVLAITYAGGAWFGLLIAAFAMALLYEWLGMARDHVAPRLRKLLWALLVVAIIPVVIGLHAHAVVIVASLCIAAGFAAAASWKGGYAGPSGLAYAVVSAVCVDQLRTGGQDGLAAIVFLFFVVWATDSFAYIVGRLIGGRKLAPSISPSKTWSGAIGGALGAVVFGGLAARLMDVYAGYGLALSALFLSAVAQCGDLFESAIKRKFGVKDSGRLIPGHGGVLDRVDGLVAAALALYVIGILLSGLHEPSRGLFEVR